MMTLTSRHRPVSLVHAPTSVSLNHMTLTAQLIRVCTNASVRAKCLGVALRAAWVVCPCGVLALRGPCDEGPEHGAVWWDPAPVSARIDSGGERGAAG